MSDLIDRQDAKDVVDMELDAIDHVPEWVYDRLLTALDKVPSAQPERKKGTWEPMFNGQFKGGAYWFSCSKCNRVVPEVRNGGWNYCPNCGAKMDG